MADYTPTQYIKGTTIKTGSTWAEHYQLIWEGYVPIGEAVVNPRARIPAMLSDVDAVEDQAEAAAIIAAANDMRATGLEHISKVEADYRSSPRLQFTTDISTLTQNAPGDVATYNRAYSFLVAPHTGQVTGSALPSTWPADMGEGVNAYVSGFHAGWGSQNQMPRSIRTVLDGDKFCWYVGTGNPDYLIYIDGRPVGIAPTGGTGGLSGGILTPYRSGNASAHLNMMTFPSKKVRMIEIRTWGYVQALYTQKPYDLYKPPPRRGPRVLIMGDSYTSGLAATLPMESAYWDIGPHIGSEDVWLDQVGGTGYGVTSNPDGSGISNRYLDRLVRNTTVPWDVSVVNPELVLVHGGGANDLYKGRSVAQVIADATAMFNGLRAKLPRAKLVFIEGFAPPVGFSGFNANYTAIRQGAQAALTATGVYYIDVATSKPWIRGTGFNGTGDATENSYAYVSSDGVHLNTAGHQFLRGQVAQKLRRILADDGTLLNALI